MMPIDGTPVLAAAAMRAAEATAVAAGATVDELMARAGAGVAAAVARLCGTHPVLVLCGPGNNGGDGYVAATALAARGISVRVAATGSARTDAARAARAAWSGPVESFAQAGHAPVLVDALFGTGARPLAQDVQSRLADLVRHAHLSIALDLPSGVGTDDGTADRDFPRFDLTLALGAVKPAHLLYPAAARCGEVRVLDIGVPVSGDVIAMPRPTLPQPGPTSHKYSRGLVAVVAGAMPGAAELSALAALRSGAGYALVLGDPGDGHPHAVVRRPFSREALRDGRIGALVIGPGLGRDGVAAKRLDAALDTTCPLVIDGDALHLLDDARLARVRARTAPAILTPHAGEFDAVFCSSHASKIDRARASAARCGAVVAFKGADTVVAAPDGRVSVHARSSSWLSTAGTGDVLTGAVGACLGALPGDGFGAACAGIWLHAEAARTLGGAFIADDLTDALTSVRASL